ncbi:MAG: MltA-interacting MipA family protein, partial [Kiritimatiellae bacterium]|nr:MltA-interacting MipA family protein [Kiritimatiellia bacterium]
MDNKVKVAIAGVTSAVAFMMVPTATLAAEASLDAAVYSAYDWRGQVLNDEAVLQPSIDVSSDNGLTVNVWGNFDLTDSVGDSEEFSEVDITVSYDLDLGENALGAQIGLIEYLFPKEDDVADADTREIFVGLSETVGEFDLSLTAYLDIDEVDGAYINAAVEHALSVGEEIGLVAGASVAFATS